LKRVTGARDAIRVNETFREGLFAKGLDQGGAAVRPTWKPA